MRLSALMINRLYHVANDEETKGLIERMKDANKTKPCCGKEKEETEKEKKEKDNGDLAGGKLHVRAGGDMEIDVPKYLDFQQAKAFLCYCCRRSVVKAFDEYSEAIELGNDATAQDLDVIRYVRRMRSHGFGLHFLLSSYQRGNAARLAHSRPLRVTKQDKTAN